MTKKVSALTHEITRATCMAAMEQILSTKDDEHKAKFAEGLQQLARVGQLGVFEGRKVLILNPRGAADMTMSPSEVAAADEAEEDINFILHIDTSKLPLVTERTLQERVGALIQLGNDYERKDGVVQTLAPMLTAAGEEAFDGFCENATLNDVIVFYANKLNYSEEDLSFLCFAQKMGMMNIPFNVSELTAVEARQ